MFITFEGSEGSGKSTQIALLAAFLRRAELEVVLTQEPGGTDIGRQIRKTLHDVDNNAMTAEAEVLLYSASRAQLTREQIAPALARGAVVLCDRFADSTIAYQGYGRGLSLESLTAMNDFAIGDVRPQLTIFLDIDVEQGLRRRVVGGDELNRMDRQAVEFYMRVRDGYLALAESEPERWVTVDASRPVEEIQHDVRVLVGGRLGLSQTA